MGIIGGFSFGGLMQLVAIGAQDQLLGEDDDKPPDN